MISINKLLLALLVVLIIEKQKGSDAARILAVFPLPGKSHFVMGEALFRGLAARGHQIDVLSHFPLKNPPPNYRDISLVGTVRSAVNNLTLDKAEGFVGANLKQLFFMAGTEVCNILDVPQIRNIIENPPTDPPYDVAIIEIFAADCFLALGRHLNVPVIGVVTAKLFDWLNRPLGNPQNTAFVPSCFSEFTQHMSYLERMNNFLLTSYINTEYSNIVHAQLAVVEKHFHLKLSSMSELYKNVALVLVNTHHSFDGVRPMTPGIVEVGGLHVVDDLQDLSSEVKKWLDESKEGFVYFSFGSMVKIESFPTKTIKAFYKAFEHIAPVRVLMKIANKDELPAGLPKNVLTSPWFPQTRVLQHKNIKAFVTHGGLMSTQEAITYGVPMVGVPIFADQYLNVRICSEKNISVTVQYREITAYSFTQAVNTILKNPLYSENSKRLSKLFTDRPMSALDTATFWVEYVIRNGNVLRSPTDGLRWWQLALLDVYAFIIAIVLTAIYIAKRLFVFVFNMLYSKFSNKQSAQSPEVALKSKKNK